MTFLVMAYLARELNTEDFGILAISTVLIELIKSITVSGIGEYAIFYNGKNLKEVLNAIFWFGFGASLIVIVVVLILTPFWADYYENDQIRNIVYLLLFGFFFQMLGEVPRAIFKKDINFKPLIATEMVFNTVANIAKVGFAFSGFGALSLALPTAIFAPFTTAVLMWKSGFVPRRYLGTEYWKEIIDFTKYVIGQRVLGKLVTQGDQLLVGTYWGVDLLGVYSLAAQFANLIPTYLIPIIQSVTSPVLAKNNHDLAKVRVHFKKILRTISFGCIPILTLLIINTEYLVLTIYGEKWVDAILPCQMIAAYVIVRSISSPTSALYNVLGKPEVGYYFTLTYAPLFLVSLFLACYYLDFVMAVLAICVVKAMGSMTHFIIVPRLTEDKVSSLLRVVMPMFLSSAAGILVTMFFVQGEGLGYFLIKSLIYGIVTLGSLILVWKRDLHVFLEDIKPMLPHGLKRVVWK